MGDMEKDRLPENSGSTSISGSTKISGSTNLNGSTNFNGSASSNKSINSNRSTNIYMAVPWHDYVVNGDDVKVGDSLLSEKASVIGRVGISLLAGGATAWFVRGSMSRVAGLLGVTCVADIGIVTINYTCYEEHESFSQSISLDGVSVDGNNLDMMEKFVRNFEKKYLNMSAGQIHDVLDEIQFKPPLYKTALSALLAGIACSCMIFICNGGISEMICVFFAAALGNLVRTVLNKQRLSLFIGIAASAATCCGVYALMMLALQSMFHLSIGEGSGYMCSMLFLIPGFPFVTSILDFAKLDMRSGLERITYSVIVVAVATAFAWVAAMLFGLSPEGSMVLSLNPVLHCALRIAACFVGIVCITMLFNCPFRIALAAAAVGAIANTLRLELIDFTPIPTAFAAFAGAFVAGLLSALIVKYTGFPRSTVVIGALMVSVPGVKMYQTLYYFGTGNAEEGLQAFIAAMLIILATAFGILFAKYITDRKFRFRD